MRTNELALKCWNKRNVTSLLNHVNQLLIIETNKLKSAHVPATIKCPFRSIYAQLCVGIYILSHENVQQNFTRWFIPYKLTGWCCFISRVWSVHYTYWDLVQYAHVLSQHHRNSRTAAVEAAFERATLSRSYFQRDKETKQRTAPDTNNNICRWAVHSSRAHIYLV